MPDERDRRPRRGPLATVADTAARERDRRPRRGPLATVADTAARERNRNPLQGVIDGILSEGTVANAPATVEEVARRAFNKGFDPEFRLSEENLERTRDRFGIPEEERGRFAEAAQGANSAEHLKLIADEFVKQTARDRRLAEGGLASNLFFRGLGILLDPVNVAGAAGTAKSVGQFVARGSRLARAGRAGGVVGAESAAQEAFIAGGDPTRGATDAILAGLAGLGLGAPLGALSRTAARQGVDVPGDAAAGLQRAQRAADEAFVARRGDPRTRDELLDEERLGVDVAGEPELEGAFGPSAARASQDAGAAEARIGTDPVLEETSILDRALERVDDGAEDRLAADQAFDPANPGASPRGRSGAADQDDFRGRLSGVRIDALNTLLKSTSRKIRALGAALAPDNIGFKDPDFAQKATAMELQEQFDVQLRVPFKKEFGKSFQDFAEANGVSALRARAGIGVQKLSDDFSEQVAAVVRGEVPESSVTAPVRDAAAAVRQMTARSLELGKRTGVLDEAIPENPNFLPRLPSAPKIQAMLADPEVGLKGIESLVRAAFRSAQPDLADEAISVLARRYSAIITRQAQGLDKGLTFGINFDDTVLLRELLEESGFTSKDIDTVLGAVKKRNETQSKIPTAKRRADIDENASVELPSGRQVRFADLLENNVEVLLDSNGRRLSGAAALKSTVGIVGTRAELQRLRDEITAAALEAGETEVQAGKRANVAEAIVRRTAGLPLSDAGGILSDHPLSAGRRAVDGIRKFNFAAFMVQSGFASVAEFGMVLSKTGFGLALEAIPEFRRFVRAGRTGRIDDDTIEFFEEYIGVGADNILNPQANRLDDFVEEGVVNPQVTKAERALNASQRVVAEFVSALGPMTRFQRRLTMFGVLKRIEDLAFLGRPLSKAQKQRLRGAGLTDADLTRIGEGLRRHGISMKSGLRNRTFKRADLEAFAAEDPETFSKLGTAIQREVKRTIIEGNLADQPLFVSTPLGRVSTQFMTFAINAYTKLLLRGVAIRDAETALGFFSSMGFASMAYIAQQHINTIGQPEKREERLSTDNIVRRSFARAGHASLLPQAVDFLANVAGEDPVFAARASGLPSGQVKSIPTIQTLDNLKQAIDAGVAAARTDRRVTRSNAGAIQSLVPVVGKMVGVRTAFEVLAEDLPRESNEPLF